MDEDKLSFRETSYLTDEVPPACFLVPDRRGQALLSQDFILEGRGRALQWRNYVPDGRSPACLISRIGQTWTSFPYVTSYRVEEDKLSFRVTLYQTHQVLPT